MILGMHFIHCSSPPPLRPQSYSISTVLITHYSVSLLPPLAGVHDTQRPHMRIDKSKVERREIQIRIRHSKENRPINRRIPLKNLIWRLIRPPLIRPRNLQRRIRQIQLAQPGQELRLLRRGGGYVAVVGADALAGLLPLEEDLAAGEREGLATVAREAGAAVVARGAVGEAGGGGGEGAVGGVSDARADEFVGLRIIRRDSAGR